MNHRERVLAALDHKETDRVPVDMGSTIVTTADAPGLPAPARAPGPAAGRAAQHLAPPDGHRLPARGPAGALRHRLPGGLPQGALGVRDEGAAGRPLQRRVRPASGRRPPSTTTWSAVPSRTWSGPATSTAVQWPDPYDPGRLAGVREEARRLFEETDYLVVADIMCLGPFEGACFLRGYEQFCMDLYWNLDMAHAILDKVTETDIALWDLFLQNVDGYVQVVAQGDDLGTQRGTWIGAGDVPRAHQAVPQAPLRLHPQQDPGQGLHALLRIRLRPHPGPHRGRRARSSTPSSAAPPRWTSPP